MKFKGLAILLISLCAALAWPLPAAAQRLTQAKIRGYVTDVRTATDFDIEDYRITGDEVVGVRLDNAAADPTFTADDIRVGVEVEVRGELDRTTGIMRATSVRIDVGQFKPVTLTAFIESVPRLQRRADGTWTGQFMADGQHVRVTPTTAVRFEPPLTGLENLEPGAAVTFRGRRDRRTGEVVAARVDFAVNELERGEAKLWKSLTTDITAAQGLTPGELRIQNVGKYTLFPSPEVQRYVAGVGTRLIPPYQAALPDSDPRKIPFQFHVVLNDSANAFATPNGIVVVYSGLLQVLENEAQLAAVLAHEIAHATHEHTWREQRYHRRKRIVLGIAGITAAVFGFQSVAQIALMTDGAIISRHSRSLENQSDRVGLQYMTRAGYDPREAPAVWRLMTKKLGARGSDLFWSSHENQATRRSYLMSELATNYREIDYATLGTYGREYQRVRERVDTILTERKRLRKH